MKLVLTTRRHENLSRSLVANIKTGSSQQARDIKWVETRPEATTFKAEEPSLRRIWMSCLTSRKYSFRMLFATSVALKPLPLRHQ